MILSGRTLFKMLEEGTLSITPLDEKQVQSTSVDIRLRDTSSTVEDLSIGIITLKDEVRYETISIDTYIFLPGQFVLATTVEYVSPSDNLIAFMEGGSSLGCLGLLIQNTGWVDPNSQEEITLELFNVNHCAIKLKAGRRAGQLVFVEMDDIAVKPYSGKYQGQRRATGSRVCMD